MSFKFPHLCSNRFSGLFNYKLSFQLGKPEGFCLGQRTKKADSTGGLGDSRAGRCARLSLSFILTQHGGTPACPPPEAGPREWVTARPMALPVDGGGGDEFPAAGLMLSNQQRRDATNPRG